MIRRLLPLLLVLAAPLAGQQREVRAMRATPDVAIRLWVPAGMVEVEGWDHDSVEVRATPTRGTRFGGGGTAEAMKFSLENLRTNDTLLPSAQMRMFVPRGARVWIKSTVAGVNVRAMNGELDVLQVGGSTHVSDVRGVITVESIDGAVTMHRVAGVIRIRGGAGATSLTDIEGTIDATLVSGTLTVNRPAASANPLNGRLETVSGMVWFIGGTGSNGRLEIITHDARIALMLRGAAPRIEVLASGDHVTVDPALKSGSPAAGTFVLRTFRGPINASLASGI